MPASVGKAGGGFMIAGREEGWDCDIREAQQRDGRRGRRECLYTAVLISPLDVREVDKRHNWVEFRFNV
jgi:hypothetical protein